MTDKNGPYGIGTETWPGLAKLMEECGEVIQVLAKLVAAGSLDHTWTETDGTPRGWGDLSGALHEELGDLQAALNFFITLNDEVDSDRIIGRSSHKFSTFCRWHAESLKG
jgi:NTP pyrophosphatase (non-canonical NTP hydrolase)